MMTAPLTKDEINRIICEEAEELDDRYTCLICGRVYYGPESNHECPDRFGDD